jgi:acetylornithine deacetylase
VAEAAALGVRQMLDRLIGLETTSRNSVLPLIEFVQDVLDRLGITSNLIFDDARARAKLCATIGSPADAEIVRSGQSEVVPVDGQDWPIGPFVCRERDVVRAGAASST